MSFSAKIIKKNKTCERYQNLSKEEKEKDNNMVVNVTKISQKMKNKSLLSLEKNIIEWEKTSYYKTPYYDLESSFEKTIYLKKLIETEVLNL